MSSIIDVSYLLKYGLNLWFWLLAGVIFYKILTGDIRLNGLLSEGGDSSITPERITTFAFMLGLISFYFITGVTTNCTTTAEACSLPDIPAGLLAILGGTNAVYISGKIIRSS